MPPDYPEWMLEAAAQGKIRQLDVFGVACPNKSCGAAPRTPCLKNGYPNPKGKPHMVRVRAAINANSFK